MDVAETILSLPEEQRLEVTKLLAEQERRLRQNRLARYQPYEYQKTFHAAGAKHRERLLMAANQVGKCISVNSLIPIPGEGECQAGELFNRRRPFPVYSWDGEKAVEAMATAGIRKPAEPLVRVYLSNGKWFECALNHRVLTKAGWCLVGSLLTQVPMLASAPSRHGRPRRVLAETLVRAVNALRWFGRASGFQWRYFLGWRRYDGQPLLAVEGDRSRRTLPAYARQHSPVSSHSDDRVHRHTNIGQPSSGLPSSWYGRLRSWVRSVGFLCRTAYKHGQYKSEKRSIFERLRAVGVVLLQSFAGALPGRGLDRVTSLVSPNSDNTNEIVSYSPIGSQEVYDFTVPGFQNYLAAGIVHHNTLSGGAELAMHLTGLYPDWWEGRRFHKPILAIAGSESTELTRDGVQKQLIGPPDDEDEWGTGFIPGECIITKARRLGVANALDTVTVKHVAGKSTLLFKSYDQGRRKWQANTADVVWFDEEPEADIYDEGLTRTNATGGMVYLTFTPNKGHSEVVGRFLGAEGDGEF